MRYNSGRAKAALLMLALALALALALSSTILAEIMTPDEKPNTKPYGVVYLIRNTVNGKVYVGQTRKTIKRRLTDHIATAKQGSHFRIHQAIRKYGRSAFTIETLGVAHSGLELNAMEAGEISRLDSCNYLRGYNMAPIACGSSDEMNRKRSASLKGRVFSEQTRAKMRASAIGKLRGPHPEHGDRMRGAWNPMAGVPMPPGHQDKLQAAVTAWRSHQSPERISAQCTRATQKSWEGLTEEQKQARIAPMLGARWKNKKKGGTNEPRSNIA